MFGGTVRGKISTLRSPSEDDLRGVNAWMADMRVRRGAHIWEEPATLSTWKERLKEAAKDQDTIVWVIEAEGKLAGLIRVSLEREAPIAELRQFLIEPEMWGRGIGSDAGLALHRYIFDYLDRRECVVELPADNERALRIAQKLGYREFGRGHDVYYRDGAYVDQLDLRFDRPVWDERWGATEREYAPTSMWSPGRADRGTEAVAEGTRSSSAPRSGAPAPGHSEGALPRPRSE